VGAACAPALASAALPPGHPATIHSTALAAAAEATPALAPTTDTVLAATNGTALAATNDTALPTAATAATAATAKANRARVDADDANGVAELRAKGMKVIDNVDKAKFVAALAPVNAGFEKDFGKANLDRIRNVK
jgi:hypothetical protein